MDQGDGGPGPFDNAGSRKNGPGPPTPWSTLDKMGRLYYYAIVLVF